VLLCSPDVIFKTAASLSGRAQGTPLSGLRSWHYHLTTTLFYYGPALVFAHAQRKLALTVGDFFSK
jgi:hypothetical protein